MGVLKLVFKHCRGRPGSVAPRKLWRLFVDRFLFRAQDKDKQYLTAGEINEMLTFFFVTDVNCICICLDQNVSKKGYCIPEFVFSFFYHAQHVKINPALLLKANFWPRLNSANSLVLTLPDVRLSPCVIRAGQCLGN